MSELTRGAVLKAIAECNAFTRKGFLEEYKFDRAREWFIYDNGRPYSAKAIASVGHKYLGSDNRYLEVDKFKGGKGSKDFGKLNSPGFVIKQDKGTFLDTHRGLCAKHILSAGPWIFTLGFDVCPSYLSLTLTLLQWRGSLICPSACVPENPTNHQPAQLLRLVR